MPWECQRRTWCSWQLRLLLVNPLTSAATSGALVCVGRLVFGRGFEDWWSGKGLPASGCRIQTHWPAGVIGRRPLYDNRLAPPKSVNADSSWAGLEMHHDVVWLPEHSLALVQQEPGLVEIASAACALGQPDRCFFTRHVNSTSGGLLQRRLEQRIWFHNPVSITELPEAQHRALRHLAVTEISEPVLWNGQDTNNIFHLLASVLGRLWLHLQVHLQRALWPRHSAEVNVSGADCAHPQCVGASATPQAVLSYVFDLHAGRAGMFGNDATPLVPGPWALELMKHAFPGVRVLHAHDLAKASPVLFRRLHFNLVNWATWVLPSEDLQPPRISRRTIGPHPLLVLMPKAVKGSLGVNEAEGSRVVLFIRRNPPSGRRLTNEQAFVDALEALGLKVQVLDFSIMLFAAQVEAVAHAAVLAGTHGQGLFNLIFLPASGAVVEVAPCGVGLALVYNVAELFGIAFSEVLDTSCDEAFMRSFQAKGCVPCYPRSVSARGPSSADLDSDKVGDCSGLDPACDVRSAQEVTLNSPTRAAEIVQAAHLSALQRFRMQGFLSEMSV